jgi:hypothetical protein
MSLTTEEIKNIKKMKGKTYNIETRNIDYSLRDIIKYVMYWKYIIENFKDEIRGGGTSFGVVGFSQLKHVSQEGIDDKSPKGILKLQSYLFMSNNDFTKDQQGIVGSYIETYYSFMNFVEYKNPIYLSIAVLCLDKSKTQTEERVEEEEVGFVYGEDIEEFRGGEGMEDYEGDYGYDEYGEDGGDDDDFFS